MAAIFEVFMVEIPVIIFAFAAAMVGPALVFIITEIIFGRKLAKGASEENFFVPKEINNLNLIYINGPMEFTQLFI